MKRKTTTAKTSLTTTPTGVVYDKQKTLALLEDGGTLRSIWRPEDYVATMGFELSAIKPLEKTYKSPPIVEGEDFDITEQIFVNGERVAELKGVSFLDFLIWFAEELDLWFTDVTWGRPAIESAQISRLILKKLKS